MAKRIASLNSVARKRTLRRWEKLANQATTLDLGSLRRARSAAKELRSKVDEVARIAESKLALPRIGSATIEAPLHTDWTYRPEIWRMPLDQQGHASVGNGTELGQEVTLFHDCPISELIIRQVRNRRKEDLAPFGLQLDVFAFEGSFLSLVLQLPEDALVGLKRRHLVRISGAIEAENPISIIARLNVRHGPNTEQVVRELPANEVEFGTDFDLAYSNLNEKRIEAAWIDLIFEQPQMNMINLRDINLSRRPRSEL